MDITVNVLWMGGLVILAIWIGYLLGRSERRNMQVEASEDITETQEESRAENTHRTERRRGHNERRIPLGKSIASPVSGEVRYYSEEASKGAVIEPEQNAIYAPMSGKITKLYPMGNSFVLRSDEPDGPKELLIQVGRKNPDELCSMYYRPHIVQNEIVNKGKLLLTFDKERLQTAGEDVSVLVSLDGGIGAQEVRVTQKGSVKVGEELMWVKGMELI